MRATSLQHIACLCLLNLSAAFDSIDHCILFCHLASRIGVIGCVLSRVKSYLSNNAFCVDLPCIKSSIFDCYLDSLLICPLISSFHPLYHSSQSSFPNVIEITTFMQMTLSSTNFFCLWFFFQYHSCQYCFIFTWLDVW